MTMQAEGWLSCTSSACTVKASNRLRIANEEEGRDEVKMLHGNGHVIGNRNASVTRVDQEIRDHLQGVPTAWHRAIVHQILVFLALPEPNPSFLTEALGWILRTEADRDRVVNRLVISACVWQQIEAGLANRALEALVARLRVASQLRTVAETNAMNHNKEVACEKDDAVSSHNCPHSSSK